MKTILTLITLFFIFTLAACGGSSGGSGTTASAEPAVPVILGVKGTIGTGSVTRFDLPSGPASKVTGRGLAGYQNVSDLAFDSNSETLYAYDLASDVLFTLDRDTGIPTEIGSVGISGISGLAFDTATDTLYAISGIRLYSVDSTTGKTSLVNNMSVSSGLQSLAFHPPTGALFTVATFTGDLYSVDPATAVVTLVGNVGATTLINGLAYNSVTQKLNGSDSATGEIVEIDPANAALTVLGPSGFCCVSGLAYDFTVAGGRLFAVESADQRLMTINMVGAATVVGSFGHNRTRLITLDTVSNILYGIDSRTKRLVSIDRISGETTDIGPTGFPGLMSALAHDSNSDTLYGVAGKQLYVFDRNTGAATFLGQVTGLTTLSIAGIAFDPNTSTMYAANFSGNAELISIDTTTWVATLVNTIGIDAVRGLAFDPANNVMYGLSDELLVIDTTAGINPSGTVIGSVGFNVARGLTFDQQSGRLFAADSVTGADLLSINPATGAAFAIGSLGYDFVEGLAFDRNTGTVYGVDFALERLLKINPATGQANVIGPTGSNNLKGLAYDPNLDILYGVDSTSTLYTIDTATGNVSPVAAIGEADILGLAFDPNTNTLYGATLSSYLYTIDTTTGVGTFIGNLGVAPLGGLAFDYDTGRLYASKTFPYELYTIDLANLAVTLAGSSEYRMDGLTYALAP